LYPGAHRVDVGRAAGLAGQGQRIIKARQPGAVMERQRAQLARLAGQGVAVRQRQWVAKVSQQLGVERLLIGLSGQRKAAGAQGPAVVEPFQRGSRGVAAGVGSKVIGAHRHQRPVQELAASAVALGVVIEQVVHRDIAHGQRDAPLADPAGQLVEVGLDRLGRPARTDTMAG